MNDKKASRRLVNRVLRAFIGELRAILKRRALSHYEKFPNAGRPCHTCAFNPSTDHWQGWDQTAYSLMKAIRDDSPFHCHENINWRKDVSTWTPKELTHYLEHRKLCAGYAAIVGDASTKDAFILAALKVNGLKQPCQQAIDLANSAIAGAGDILR